MESSLFLVITAVLGGLALFLLGMNIMTQGLRAAAGTRLRSVLARAGRSRRTGISLGTLLGFLVHSSAATVMLVAFVNAGLTTLVEAIPAVFGANVGTTLSMQLISFKLGKYAFFVIASGFTLRMAGRGEPARQVGNAILGFGLIFLGMNVMSDAIYPYRDDLRPLLIHVNATSFSGMFIGIALSLGITAIIQSSGATIGMCFALIQADVFTQFSQVYPIVLGAHVGTCATALLGSIGTNIEARRTAAAHLIFNLLTVVFAIVLSRPFIAIIQATSPDMVRQTANLHTFLAVVTTLALIPFVVPFARLVQFCVPTRKKQPEPSYLDPELLPRPEEAIYAAILELRRVAGVCRNSLCANGELLLFTYRRGTIQHIRLNEQVINEIKLSMRAYLQEMTNRYLSRRQALLVQHLDRCIVEIERIGDHIESLCDLSLQRRNQPQTIFGAESFDHLFELFEKAIGVLSLVIESLDPDLTEHEDVAKRIMEGRDDYVQTSLNYRAFFYDEVAEKRETPLAGLYYSRYIATLDRIVKHAKIIALAEQQSTFWVKRKKLGRVAAELPKHEVPKLVETKDYLHRLQSEDLL